jgi:hypothetical protein
MRLRSCLAHGFALTLALAVAPAAWASGAEPPSDLYPTDVCVAEKLRAAALYCYEAIALQDRDDRGHDRGRGHRHGRHCRHDALDHAKERLEAAWSRAEARSLEDGVSCTDTTATAEEIAASFDASAETIADAIDTSSSSSRRGWFGWFDDLCEAQRQRAAARACLQLVRAESRHMLQRSEDRTRERLEDRQERVFDHLEHAWSRGFAKLCSDEPSAEEAAELVDTAVDEALQLTYVSPRVSTEWTMITPDAEVSYGDATLAPTCGNGGPWVFFAKRGSVNKTVMYYQGGGACWSYLTCTLPTYKTSTGPGDNPANASSGFADLEDPQNPFGDWNAVFVPYCTGDVHWGDAVVDHEQGQGANHRKVTIRHKGYVNAQVAEKWAREHFSNPEQVFVTGSSAGAYGAIVNSLPLQEYVWPSSQFAVLGDAGNGVITRDFLENDLAKWGVEQNLPAWIPGLNLPLTELSAADLWTEAALFYPHNRFANYTTAYDGGQGGQVGFYNIMLNIDFPVAWFFWWRPSCEWNSIMRSLVQETSAAAANYRYYVGSGSRHTMWGNDKVYTDTTGGVPTVVDWVNAMLEDSPDWVNVETTDPGLLLPGDPRPVPSEDPYYDDDGGRIFCE